MSDNFENTVEPPLKTDADYQRRLMNFETGKSNLLPGHMQWLDWLLLNTPETRNFNCHIYGYASKLGDAEKNKRLAYERASAIARYLEARNPRYTSRMDKFESRGEEDPNYKAGESDNDPLWRAAEVHFKYDRPPIIKIKVIPIPSKTHTKWSVCGYFTLMTSVFHVAQFGVSLYKFRNDETKQVQMYISPMSGIGGGYDVTKLLGWIKAIGDKKLPVWAHLEHLAEKIMKNPALLANPKGVVKEIGKSILTGTGVSDWTDFTKCEVYLPLTFNILDGQTISNVSVTGGNFQTQKIYVYGKVWYTEKSGTKMFGNRDLLSASSSGWQAQVPALSAGAIGGPLFML